MSFDVFISYASKDKIVADAVCARLEAAGIRCWIAPRDIVAGTSYGEAIIDAIHGAKVMVLVFSSSANASGHIPKEVERAVSSGVAILPFRIEDVAPGKSLDYFIGSVHWLDAMTPPMEKHLDSLATTVHKLIPQKRSEPAPGGTSAGSLDGTVMWQRGVPGSAAAAGVAATTAATGAVAGASAGVNGGGLSGKKIWIGVAVAVVLLFALVMMFSRGGGDSGGTAGGNSTSGGNAPAVTNPAGDGNTASDPNVGGGGGGKTATPPTAKNTPTPRSSSANANVDPIVGCYQWFNNTPVVIHADGTVSGGPFTARWRLVDAQQARVHVYVAGDGGDADGVAGSTLDERRKSVRVSDFGRARDGERGAGGNLALGERMECGRRAERHVYERDISRNLAGGGCGAGIV